MQEKAKVEKFGKGSQKLRHLDNEYLLRKKKMNKPVRKQKNIEI